MFTFDCIRFSAIVIYSMHVNDLVKPIAIFSIFLAQMFPVAVQKPPLLSEQRAVVLFSKTASVSLWLLNTKIVECLQPTQLLKGTHEVGFVGWTVETYHGI